MNHDNIIEELRSLLRERKIVPIIGAGVSMTTAHTPGWKDLLSNGVEHLKKHHLLMHEKEVEIENALKNNELTKAAAIIKTQLGAPGGEYLAWIKNQFDDSGWTIYDSILITEILDLPCPLVATTNYDKLLERFDANIRRTTIQTQPASMIETLRDGGIFHFHGIYSEPDSIILSDEDYNKAFTNSAYRSAIESLWMTKSFLFIGCSFDGITDPDFSKLFNWAAETFGPTPHRHYALMLDEAANVENTRRFLLGDLRLQIVPFGERYAELARFIAGINPEREESRLRRAQRAAELLASPDSIDAMSYINVLGPWLPPTKIVEFEAEALIALKQRIDHVERNRTTLKFVKAVCDNLPEKNEIIATCSVWDDINTYSDNIHHVCMAALTAISTVPLSFFRQLNKKDNVFIHGSVVEGKSQSHVEKLESLHGPLEREHIMQHDSYGFELAGRILRTFKTICNLQPDVAFPLPLKSVRTNLRGTFIAIGTSSRISIIDANCFSVATFLETDNRVRDCAEIDFRGYKALLVLMSDRLLIWDPRRSGLPLADVPVTADDIATHIVVNPTLLSGNFWVNTSGGQLLFFQDAQHIKTVTLTTNLTSFAFVDGQLYGSSDRGDIFQVSQDALLSHVIDRNELATKIVQICNKFPDVEKICCASDIEKISLFLQHSLVQTAYMDGREILVICVRFDLTINGCTAIFLWRFDEGFLGYWLLQGRVASLGMFTDYIGPCLFVTLMSHFEPDEPLILWGRPTVSTEPLYFSTFKSGACVQQDLFSITRLDNKFFAVDTDGQSYIITDDASVATCDIYIGTEAYVNQLLKW